MATFKYFPHLFYAMLVAIIVIIILAICNDYTEVSVELLDVVKINLAKTSPLETLVKIPSDQPNYGKSALQNQRQKKDSTAVTLRPE